MKPTNNSSSLKELRIKLGIKTSLPNADIDRRATEFSQQADWVIQKQQRAKNRGRRTEPQYRWTQDEDEKLISLRASGFGWTSIAKQLHKTPAAAKYRLSRLQARPRGAAEAD
jgi:hypothetical protein